MDNNIKPDTMPSGEVKSADTKNTNSTTNTSSPKESIAIAQVLQETIKLLSQKGLDSIKAGKAILSLKGLFPSEFSQIQLEERQSQINKPTTASASFPALTDKVKNAWFNGQVLHAKVLEIKADGKINLIINKQSVEVQIEKNNLLKLQPGQNLALVVEKTADNSISLILASTPEQSAKLIHLIQAMVTKQQAMPALLASIDSVLQQTKLLETNKPNSEDKATLPTPLVKEIEQLLNKISSSQQLSIGEGLKQAISNSGIFLENNIQIKKDISVSLNKLNTLLISELPTSSSTQVNILSKIFDQLEISSQKLSNKININVNINIESIQKLDKSIQALTENRLDLKQQLNPLISQTINQQYQSSIDKNFLPSQNNMLTSGKNNLKNIFSQLNLVSKIIEHQLTIQLNLSQISSSNTYPKGLAQSINQVLEQISKQFSTNNKTLMNNSKPSFAQSQAKQFSLQIQQIVQTISYSLPNSGNTATLNSQVNNDLKLNFQRLLSVLQSLNTSQRQAAQISSSTNVQSSSPLLANSTSQDSELNRQALPTRHKHAQVAAAQQNQLLQMSSPILFQKLLAEQVEGVMSRIVATQAATREQLDSNINMALEIPFKFQDKSQVLQLKFRSDDKDKNKSKEKIWSANLAFELQSLGAIRIYIVLDGKDVSIQFWTEKPATQKIFVENFSSLKDRLKIAGYQISEMTAAIGIPDDAEKEIKISKKGIVDEKV